MLCKPVTSSPIFGPESPALIDKANPQITKKILTLGSEILSLDLFCNKLGGRNLSVRGSKDG